MKRILKFTNSDNHVVEVFNPETVPDITWVIRVDAPGERAVSCSVPESFFADVFNLINVGESENVDTLPGYNLPE